MKSFQIHPSDIFYLKVTKDHEAAEYSSVFKKKTRMKFQKLFKEEKSSICLVCKLFAVKCCVLPNTSHTLGD